MSFQGLRVVSFESRRASEMAELIRRQGGEAVEAPSMRESPAVDNGPAYRFAERLFGGEFDMMVLLTGVGTRALDRVLSARYGEQRFAAALRGIAVVARGPKPAAVLREMQVPITVLVPEPNTWRELLAATAERAERRIAVQEYGKSNPDLLEGLKRRGAEVTAVRVYEWDLPEDAGPLRAAAARIAQGGAEVAMFTTSIQIAHLFRIAAEQGLEREVREGLRRMAVASIGPATTEALEDFGVPPDFAPSHPKMGFLVKEAAEQASAILDRKRGADAPQ